MTGVFFPEGKRGTQTDETSKFDGSELVELMLDKCFWRDDITQLVANSEMLKGIVEILFVRFFAIVGTGS